MYIELTRMLRYYVVIGSDVTVHVLILQDYNLNVCIFVCPRFVMCTRLAL